MPTVKGSYEAVFIFSMTLGEEGIAAIKEKFQTLIEHGATVIVIEHDLDVIRSADYLIDMGPGGGNDGGRIVVSGTPEEVRRCKQSVTGHYI